MYTTTCDERYGCALYTVHMGFQPTITVSYTLLSIPFHSIAGIGDRHLENLLIDVTTGSVIQIDFGICFGMGSSVLQVDIMRFSCHIITFVS